MDKLIALISDLDGTLAFHNGRGPYEYNKCNTDICNESLAEMLRLEYEYGREIIILTARPDSCREMTTAWLDDNAIPHTTIHMRTTGDNRPDMIIKEEIYHKHIENEYYIQAVFDDRLRVCKMYHSLGLPIYRVGDPEASY